MSGVALPWVALPLKVPVWLFAALWGLVFDFYLFVRDWLMLSLLCRTEKRELHAQLDAARSFEQWQDAALKLDHLYGNDVWRSDPASPDYDYQLIASLVLKLNQLRRQRRFDELADVIRSGLIRNMGSIASQELYTRAYAGTKAMIDDYLQEVIDSLVALHDAGLGASPNYTAEDAVRMSLRAFFRDTRQSYGRTALILHGGSLFGLCHLGVVKGLLAEQLLPSVVCGATVGSIVAAYVCSIPGEEMIEAIDRVPTEIISPWASSAAAATNNYGSEQLDLGGLAETALHSLFTIEILMFYEYVAMHLGDLTFEEAYLRSGRILNILVLPSTGPASGAGSCGTFYNYLTAPKVVIRSAMLASIGTGLLPGHKHVDLYVKDYEGNVVKHPDSPQIFLPANQKTFAPPRSSPYAQLSELFNVNNYVVSVSRPYFAPLLLSGVKYRGQPRVWQRLVSLAVMSAQYRAGQAADWGLLSPRLKSVFVDEMIPGGFQVNIVPEPDALIRDLLLVFDSANIWQKTKHWIDLGERSVWPHVSIIYARTKIEFVLEELHETPK